MTDKIDDGGPAYPVLDDSGVGLHLRHPGMSLRDHFAGLAMQQIMGIEMARMDRWEMISGNDNDTSPPWDNGDAKKWAEDSYLVADAMLAARKEK